MTLQVVPAPFVVRRGAGMPLIFVHGNGVDHRLLLALDDVFAEGEWERIYLDLPGFGRTPALPGAGGLPELADWLVRAVHEIVGAGEFALLANSLGGLLARYVTSRLPDQVRGLALLAPVVDPDRSRRSVPAASVVERDDALLAELDPTDRDEFTGNAVRQTRAGWEAFRDHALPGIRAADPRAMSRLGERYALDTVPEAGTAPFLAPTLIVTGRQDPVVGYRDQFALLDHYSAATYAVVDGAGHNVHLDAPGPVAALLREWGGRVRAARDGAEI